MTESLAAAYRPEPPTEAEVRGFTAPMPTLERRANLEGIEIISGRSNPQLARDVVKILGLEVDDDAAHDFSNREINVGINPNLRNREVFIIQPTANTETRSVNDHMMEIFLLADAAKLGSAEKVIAVVPHYGYARQDRKDKPRVPISAALIARLMVTAGVDRIFTLDLHAEQTMGTIAPRPWDNLYGSRVLLPAVKELGLKKPVVASADVGAAKKAQKFAHLLDGTGDIAIVNKEREHGNAKAKAVIGEVDGRDVVIVDDMIDTAGTLLEATRLIKEEGANRIIVLATHGIFSGPALERIEQAPIDQVIVTDSIQQPSEVTQNPKITIVSVAGLLAEGIKRIHTGDSLSELIPAPKKAS